MSKLVVFQWGRLGDLVQTGIVLSRWRAQRGGTITLVYDRRYQYAVNAFADIDVGIPLDIQLLVESARRNAASGDALSVLKRIVSETPALRGGSHLVLTRSPSAALMSLLLEPDRQLGYTWVRGGLQVPPLLNDFLNETESHPYPVHLCDVWSMLAELKCEPLSLRIYSDSPTRSGKILIFADAGESYRTPPLKWLCDLSERIIRFSELKVTFVGSKRGLTNDSVALLNLAYGDRVTDLRGKTSVKDLIEICRNHETAIGSDTGGLHLSSVCGCRVIGLYFGGASVYNTGPYSENAAVLQNPEWTESEIEILLQLIRNESSLPDSHILRPVWDSGGMTYISDGHSVQQYALRNARSLFLEKWTAPMRKPLRTYATTQIA